jgi:hypothetical protein
VAAAILRGNLPKFVPYFKTTIRHVGKTARNT